MAAHRRVRALVETLPGRRRSAISRRLGGVDTPRLRWDAGGMQAADAYREHTPSPELAHHVECLWTESPAASRLQRVVPDGAVDFLFELDRGRALVVGAMTRPRLVPIQAKERTLAIRFRPGGAAPLMGIAIDALTDREVPLDDFWPDARSLLARLADNPTLASAQADLGQALRVRLAHHTTRDSLGVSPAVREGIRLLTSRSITVARVSEIVGCSRQHLAREVRRATGLSPKQLSSVVRCRRVLSLLPSRAADLAGLAAACGYFDQAHMTGEFTRLVGVSPRRYLRDRPGSNLPRQSSVVG